MYISVENSKVQHFDMKYSKKSKIVQTSTEFKRGILRNARPVLGSMWNIRKYDL